MTQEYGAIGTPGVFKFRDDTEIRLSNGMAYIVNSPNNNDIGKTWRIE